SPSAFLSFLCFPLPSTWKTLTLCTSFLQNMASGVEGTLEGSGSVVMPSEASEPHCCPICLCDIKNAACLPLCLHRFCSSCIQKWATRAALCPLCRQPFDHVLHSVRADDDYQEYVFRSSTHRRSNSVRERPHSRTPWQRRWSRSYGSRAPSMDSGQVSRGHRARVPSSISSHQAPAPSAPVEQSPPNTGERLVNHGYGTYVRIDNVCTTVQTIPWSLEKLAKLQEKYSRHPEESRMEHEWRVSLEGGDSISLSEEEAGGSGGPGVFLTIAEDKKIVH
uniref:RING-type E3 ubiquitin transferase n=1 Tax=Anas platyrhynchos platyrhynchos TaxID=8840 RepID=U3I2S7_ANAPP